MRKIDSVDKWFTWRKDARKDASVENFFELERKKLKWDYTDVLYSFLGIYAIGVWVFYSEDNDNFRRTPYKIFDKNQNIYSFKYLEKHHGKYKELNELPELKNFIVKYFSIGNFIPIWPGGNSHRGQSDCFDIPEIYFNKNKSFAYCLLVIYENAALCDVINNDMPSKTPEFLDRMNKDNYKKFLKNIVAVITNREIALKKI